MSATANTEKTRERVGKNAGEWTRRIETSKEEIPGSKRGMHGYTLTHPRPLSSGFSTDALLHTASAVPHCWDRGGVPGTQK